MEQRETTPNVINILAGIWLIITPFIFGYGALGVPTTNHVVFGIIVALVAIIKLFYRVVWLSWVNVIAGLWLVVSPFILGFAGLPGAAWNGVILGVVVIFFSGWSVRILQASAHRIRTA